MDKEDIRIVMMFAIIFIIVMIPTLYSEHNKSKLQIEKQKTEQLRLQLDLKKNN